MEGMNKKPPVHAFGDTKEPEVETDADGASMPTEDEQMDYDMIVTRALKQIHGKGMENILKMLGSGERPSQAVGQVVAGIVSTLKQSAADQGRKISDNTLQHAGVEIIEDLIELAEAKGVFTFESEEERLQEAQDAGLWAVKYYGENQKKQGKITPEMQGQAQEDMKAGVASEQGAAAPATQEPGGMIASEMKPEGAM